MSGTRRDEEELNRKEVASAPTEMTSMSLELTTPLHPPEDEAVVRSTILNLFPTLELETVDGFVKGRGEGPISVAHLRRRLREMRIRDTARSQFNSGTNGDAIKFSLNKQSAFARIPNFSTGGAPLGDLEVILRTNRPKVIIQWLCELDED